MPGAVGLVVLSTGYGRPRPSALSTVATVSARMQCAQGYSGCNGVSIGGDQVTSRSVPSCPSMSPLRIAVLGIEHSDPLAAICEPDHSRELSPFDRLLYAMLGARAMAPMQLGRHDEAADWALKAAARPNAHVHILGIAAHGLALAEHDIEGSLRTHFWYKAGANDNPALSR